MARYLLSKSRSRCGVVTNELLVRKGGKGGKGKRCFMLIYLSIYLSIPNRLMHSIHPSRQTTTFRYRFLFFAFHTFIHSYNPFILHVHVTKKVISYHIISSHLISYLHPRLFVSEPTNQPKSERNIEKELGRLGAPKGEVTAPCLLCAFALRREYRYRPLSTRERFFAAFS